MIKKLFVFFLMCMIPNMLLAGIGETDRRNYVDWNKYPYSVYVRVHGPDGAGTGQLVGSKYILTNKHVAEGERVGCCGIDGIDDCYIEFSDGWVGSAHVIDTGGGLATCGSRTFPHKNDWSILEVTFMMKKKGDGFDADTAHLVGESGLGRPYFRAISSVPQFALQRAGFGGLKKLTNEDIKNIKESYKEWLKKVYPHNFMARRAAAAEGSDLEWGRYSVYNRSEYKTFLEEFKKRTGKDFIDEYLRDGSRLKAVNCSITRVSNGTISHSCQGWHGDSGSAILNIVNQIVGLDNSGISFAGTSKADSEHNFGVAIHSTLLDRLKNLEKKPDDSRSDDRSPEDPLMERIVGIECLSSDLPSGAISGHYISGGSKKYDCSGGVKCSCAATMCGAGYYLYVNTKGRSMGWCYSAKKRCPSGQHLNVIDEYKTDGKCVDDVVEYPDVMKPVTTDGSGSDDVSAETTTTDVTDPTVTGGSDTDNASADITTAD